jgi:L-lactate utilization protein LutC
LNSKTQPAAAAKAEYDEDNYSQVPRDNRSMKFYSVVTVVKTYSHPFSDNMEYQNKRTRVRKLSTQQPTANMEHAIKALSTRPIASTSSACKVTVTLFPIIWCIGYQNKRTRVRKLSTQQPTANMEHAIKALSTRPIASTSSACKVTQSTCTVLIVG